MRVGELSKRAICAVVLGLASLACTGSALADAPSRSLEVQEYRKDFGVAASEANTILSTQETGAEADVAGTLEARLGPRYAGIWFDNDSGEFVVPVLGAVGREKASDQFGSIDLGDSYRTVHVDSSWEELEAAQETLNQALSQYMTEGLVETWIDPRANAVVAEVTQDLSVRDTQHARELVQAVGADAEVRTAEVPRFSPEPFTCATTLSDINCGTPLRGGVDIGEDAESGLGLCTAGFKAIGKATGDRYVVTAGHCARYEYNINNWAAYEVNGENEEKAYSLGSIESAYFGQSGHDFASIKATGSKHWDVSPWPSMVVEVDPKTRKVTNSEHPITSEASSFIGEYACHTGIATGTSCGYVRKMNVSVEVYKPSTKEIVPINNLTELYPVCDEKGDSGGPVFAVHAALGITSVGDTELPECKNYDLYEEITEADQVLGVTVGANTNTQTWINSVSAVNGNPGWVTVKGQVFAPSTVNNAHVNVKFFKWESEKWVEKATLEAPVVNGNYEINNWHGVGPGAWIAKAVFPAQNGLGESTSDETHEGSFTVNPASCKTETTVTSPSVINGQPGFVSFNGSVSVSSPECGTVNGQYVNVNYSKKVAGTYQYQETDHPTVANGSYSMTNRVLGGGEWKIRVVFPSQDQFKESETGDHPFAIVANGWHIDNLGGGVTAAPDISSQGSGKLDVFARGTDNALWMRSWPVAGGWGNWVGMGGSLTGGLGAVSWSNGRIDLVMPDASSNVSHWYWPGSSGWGADSLGGPVTADADISSWGTNRLDVFARDANGTLVHKYWAGAGWSSWENMGAQIVGGPSAVSWGSGRIDVVARMADNTIGHWYWNNGWSYDNLGGTLTSDPEISSQGSGKLDVFARGTDNGLWHKWWAGSGWSSWEAMGGSILSAPGAVSWGPGRIDVVARNWDNTLTHWWFG